MHPLEGFSTYESVLSWLSKLRMAIQDTLVPRHVEAVTGLFVSFSGKGAINAIN